MVLKTLARLLVALLVALTTGSTWAAVAEVGSGTRTNSTDSLVTTISLTTFTAGASATCVLGYLALQDTSPLATGVGMTWNGVAMTLAVQSGVADNFSGHLHIFRLTNPATGNLTLTANWTNSQRPIIGASAWSGTDTSTCVADAHAATNSGTSTTASVTVTSSSDGATTALLSDENDTHTAQNQTLLWLNVVVPSGLIGTANYALGGSSNTHTATINTSQTWRAVGVHILATAAPGGYILTESGDCINAENSNRLITEDVSAGVGPCAAAGGASPLLPLMGVGS